MNCVTFKITDADEVPIFLSTATRIFEQLATFNAQETTIPSESTKQRLTHSTASSSTLPMVNCVDVYRASASGCELYNLEYTYADRLPLDLEKASSTAHSTEQRLVRLAQLIKRFLRQLPEPVIPSEMYQRTLDLAVAANDSRGSTAESPSSFNNCE